jgi:GNAT superfamily N-acetyltransferase
VKPVQLDAATPNDIAAVVALGNAANARLGRAHGQGHWSRMLHDGEIGLAMKRGAVYVRRQRGRVVATLTLSSRKPWSIDAARFPARARPVYLTGLAVHPDRQGQGLGRACLAAAADSARVEHDAIRLDVYDHPAGAAGFYLACGFTDIGPAIYRGVPLRFFALALEPPRSQRDHGPKSGVR